MTGTRAAGLALAVAVAAGPTAAEMPAEIGAFTEENLMACREAGGTPSLSGPSVPGAGVTTDGRPAYLTEAELNGDGRPDYITDLAGLECVNAWSYFCGSAGCPVTVWLSGPAGLSPDWGGHAQGWELRGTEVALFLHGQLCTPPRVGADSCEVVLTFAGHAAAGAGTTGEGIGPQVAAPAPTAAAAPPPAPRTGWTAAPMPDGVGWFAGITDDAAGRRLDWLCAKGRQSVVALSPYDGGPRIAIDADGRVQEFEVSVANGAAYMPVDLTSPLFIHLISGKTMTVRDTAGAVLGRFVMEGAPSAIGQAEGRCRV